MEFSRTNAIQRDKKCSGIQRICNSKSHAFVGQAKKESSLEQSRGVSSLKTYHWLYHRSQSWHDDHEGQRR